MKGLLAGPSVDGSSTRKPHWNKTIPSALPPINLRPSKRTTLHKEAEGKEDYRGERTMKTVCGYTEKEGEDPSA